MAMAEINEIAPDVYRISVYNPDNDFQFNSFLVKDEAPLLYHTNLRRVFPEVREAVSRILAPETIRYVGFSHYEPDECGALDQWLALAPDAQPLCSLVGARVMLSDWCDRPARVLAADERLDTGSHRFQVLATAHVPHGWDASLLFEETGRTLFVSDLFGHGGHGEAITGSDIVGRADAYTRRQLAGPMAHSMPYTPRTGPILESLAALSPATLATMHGTSFRGDGAAAIRDLAAMLKETIGAAA
jgi:flavorubredoxin